jgi:hypothetical protein
VVVITVIVLLPPFFDLEPFQTKNSRKEKGRKGDQGRNVKTRNQRIFLSETLGFMVRKGWFLWFRTLFDGIEMVGFLLMPIDEDRQEPADDILFEISKGEL